MTMRRMFIFVFVLLGMVLAGNSSEGDRGIITELLSTDTWTLEGYAVGKNAGNESGGISMADVILLDNGNYRMYYDQMSSAGFVIKNMPSQAMESSGPSKVPFCRGVATPTTGNTASKGRVFSNCRMADTGCIINPGHKTSLWKSRNSM